MTNSLLDAVRRYPEVSDKTLADIYSSSISINQAGERLEYFIKDLVSDSLDAGSKANKDAQHKQHLSWRGAQNHPPDIHIKRIDAPDPSNPQNQLSCVLIESI